MEEVLSFLTRLFPNAAGVIAMFIPALAFVKYMTDIVKKQTCLVGKQVQYLVAGIAGVTTIGMFLAIEQTFDFRTGVLSIVVWYLLYLLALGQKEATRTNEDIVVRSSASTKLAKAIEDEKAEW